MCGICFSVKQSFTWRQGHTSGHPHLQQRHSPQPPLLRHNRSSSSNSIPTNTTATTTIAPRVGTNGHGQGLSSSTTLTALEDRGIIDGYPLTPCPVAYAAGFLGVVQLHGCRRQYVPPTSQALRAVAGSELFIQVLENIRRRGPETFGATRRVLDEECVLVRPTTTRTTTAAVAIALAPVPAAAAAAAKRGREPSSLERQAKREAKQGDQRSPARRLGEAEALSVASAASPSEPAVEVEGEGEEEEEVLLMRTELQGVSAVLGLRGHATVHQPFEMEVETDLEEEDEGADKPVNKSFLLWNGEIFNGVMCPPPWGSDTVVLASRLSQLEQECVPTSEADPMNFLSLRVRQGLFLARCVQAFEEEVQGPYGFLFYASQLQFAVFGRDPLGRHSLLAHIAIHHRFASSSATATATARNNDSAAHVREERGDSRPAVLDVELIVSSVGIQHATRLSAASALAQTTPATEKTSTSTTTTATTATSVSQQSVSSAAVADGERKRPRPSGGEESPSQPTTDDAVVEVAPSATATAATPTPAKAAPEVPEGQSGNATGEEHEIAPHGDVAAATAASTEPTTTTAATAKEKKKAKRQKTGKAEARTVAAEEDEDAHNTTGAAAAAGTGVDEEEGEHGCWVELPVTGLFAVALDRPLVDEATLLSSHAGGDCGCEEKEENSPGATSATTVKEKQQQGEESAVEYHRLDAAGVAAATAQGILLHCPWRDRYHLVHPLLRAFVAVAEEQKEQLDTEQESKRQEVSSSGSAKEKAGMAGTGLLPLPFGLPSAWIPPKRPLLFSVEDTVPALPPLLADCIRDSAPPPGSSDDTVWAHWAATCYLHALSAAVLRRTDVAASGAEDSRDWATFSKALRRPLCVLFSGGIDCTVLAALAHHVLPLETPIELVNVAFGASPEQAPDRLAALRAVEELVRLPQPEPHPDSLTAAASQGTQAAREREWRLVLVDVPAKLSEDTEHILDLVTPRHTVMDLDIGTALWYAARGAGRMQILRHSDLVIETGALTSGVGEEYGEYPYLQNFNKHVRVAPLAMAATTTTAGEPLLPSQTAKPTRGLPPYPFQQRQQHQLTASSASPAREEGGGGNGGGNGNGDGDRFRLLLEVLIKEGRQGDGPSRPVLLSTLGKEYGDFLQPHIAAYGYKKIGAFLNDACKAGLIQFDHAAPSKAVLLVREEDRRRAMPPPPCCWFRTPAMRLQQQKQQQECGMGGGSDALQVGAADGAAQAAAPLLPPPGTYNTDYVSQAKVLLLGMGADETLGGYTRYRRFFGRHGMQGTRQELEKDFARLWRRNLGRDDRITMDSGREPRFPYLDEELLGTLEKIVAERRKALLSTPPPPSDCSTFATLLQRKAEAKAAAAAAAGDGKEAAAVGPTEEEVEGALLQTSLEPIVSFRLGPGEGDKRALRTVAAMIGLQTVTRLQKRAIQFGTRVADRRVSGTTEL